MCALQHRVRRVGYRRNGDRRRHRRVDVLGDLSSAGGDLSFDLASTDIELGRIRRFKRLELGDGSPLGIDRQSPAVR